MGVAGGMDQLRWLFVLTSIISLIVVLVFGGVVARTNRRRFIPLAYLFVIACLVIFAALLFWDAAAGGGLIGTDAESTLSRGVGYTFFVWLSAINLFTTSVFWAFMADIFNVDQGKRMFAFIGIGGTVGALAGGWTTAWISGRTESIHLPAGMMLSSALLFGLAIAVVLLLDRMAVRSGHSQRAASAGRASGTQAGLGRQDVEAGPRQPIGGTFWEGAKDVATSPYMLGIGVWIVFMAIANTMIYFTQANIISGATDTFSQSVASFAQFDALAQLATLITQVLRDHTSHQEAGRGMDARDPAGRHPRGLRDPFGLDPVRRDGDLSGRPSRDALRRLTTGQGNPVQRPHTLREVQGEDSRGRLPLSWGRRCRDGSGRVVRGARSHAQLGRSGNPSPGGRLESSSR